MRTQIITVSAAAVLLSACAKDSDSISKDADGNCSSSYVSDYNSIVDEIRRAQWILDSKIEEESAVIKQLTSINNACQRFKANHSGVSCKAEVDYREKWVSSSDFDSTCDRVNSILANETSGSSPAPAPSAPSPVAPIANPYSSLMGVKVKDAKYDYSFEVVDASSFLFLLKDSNKFLMEGELFDFRFLTSSDKRRLNEETACGASELKGGHLFESDLRGKELAISNVREVVDRRGEVTFRLLVFSIDVLDVEVVCLKSSSLEDFTWLEVQKAFAGILEVNKKELPQGRSPTI